MQTSRALLAAALCSSVVTAQTIVPMGAPSQPPSLPFGPPPRKPAPAAHAAPTPDEAVRIAASERLTRATGDHARAYWFAAGGTLMPYRLFVPSRWDGRTKLPMIVVLHGGGSDENGVFDRAGDVLKPLAEKHGYIVVVPLGYTTLGGFGAQFTPPPAPNGAKLPPFAGDAREAALSEADTLAVIDRTMAEYGVDRSRIYLMGNSMGGAGTWYLGERYPTRWAAIAPSDGPPTPAEYPFARLRGVHILAVHGEKDVLAPIAVTLEMVALAREAGADVTFLPVAEGEHGTAWIQALPRIFAYFDADAGRR